MKIVQFLLDYIEYIIGIILFLKAKGNTLKTPEKTSQKKRMQNPLVILSKIFTISA
jgi:hypothetical protein